MKGAVLAGSTAGLGGMARALPGSWGVTPPRGSTNRTQLTVVMGEPTGTLHRSLLGHFAEHLGSCIYDGMWVGPDSSIPNIDGLRRDTIAALRRIHAPIIRWPGGAYAETYHWRDAIGPRERRPRGWNICWEREESNAFGTDEFLEYCRQCGAEPYLCINVSSGSVEEAVAWMEYCNSSHPTALTQLRAANGHAEPYGVRYWGIGNEDYFNFVAEEYARRYALFAEFLSSFWRARDLEFVACGHHLDDWNRKFFEELLRRPIVRPINQLMSQLSIHQYFGRGPAVDFTDEDYYGLLAEVSDLEGVLRQTIGVIDEFTEPGAQPIGIAVDEWGVGHPGSSEGKEAGLQPNTMRDAMLAAVVLNCLNSFGNRVTMACLSETFNVLQCIAFTRGPQMIVTPTYYVLDLFQPHMDATGLRAIVDSPTFGVVAQRSSESQSLAKPSRPYLSASASRSRSGNQLTLTLANQHLTGPLEVDIELVGTATASGGTVRELTSASVHDHNTFENREAVKPPSEKRVSLSGRKFTQSVPGHSVQSIVLDLG